MGRLLKALKNPILIFGLLIAGYGLYDTLQDDNVDFVIRSDGRGYYAYLPALFIYNDGSFQQSAEVEKSYYEHSIDQLYLFKDRKGNQYNKYFPGIAILQAPFFAIACFVAWISGFPVDGYSAVFRLFFYIGSLFYFICGLLLFSKCLRLLFPGDQNQKWLIPMLYFATPLLFYSLFTPSFSHLYSFFLFGMFAWLILKLKQGFTARKVFFAALVLGLITLLRPTNLLVIAILPFLLGSAAETKLFFQRLFKPKAKYFLLALLGFMLVLSVVFLSWKWQTGSWIVWSYSGEGFNFLHPKLFATLFSFRTGLFLHTPLMLLSLVGVWLIFRESKFKALSWAIYFLLNIWVIASWWCWDYESVFGNRPVTEHFLFLLIPVVYFAAKYQRIAIVAISLLSVVGLVRLYEMNTGFMGDQRFTRHNYIPSLQFWKASNHNRWNFTRSCEPFGKKIKEAWLLNEPAGQNVTAQDEFISGVEATLHQPRSNERFYYRVELQKMISEPSLDGVMLVIDATSKDNSKRYYKTTDLFNDRFEGNGSWSENLVFEGQIHDYLQEYDLVKIYIWNQARKTFKLKNVKIVLEEYKS